MTPALPCGRLQRSLWPIAVAIVLLALAATAWSAGRGRQQPDVAADSGFPTLTGWVVDAANPLSPGDEAALAAQSAGLERRTGHQFVVATVAGLGGHTIEEYSLRLARHWGIGRKGIDDGIMLLVAPHERKVRIEVGYGLEKIMTNTEAAHIIDTAIVPSFRAGQTAAGITRGAEAIVADLSGKQA